MADGEPRPARPGDICVLLRPIGADVVELHRRQRELQASFGGRVHRPVHLTCQRFRLGDRRPRREVIASLVAALEETKPLAVHAASLVVMEHGFWQSRLLRWRVQSRLELKLLGRRLEQVLSSEGIRPHFPLMRGWLPRYVTALEDVPEGEFDAAEGERSFPCRLFEARRMVFSAVEERRRFRILGRVRLGGD